MHAIGNYKFGSGIAWRPKTCLYEFVGLVFELVGEAQARDHYISLTIKEKAPKREVAMNGLFLVNVPDARDELTEEFTRILLLQVPPGKDVIGEFATRRILKDETDELVCFDNLAESDDARVFEGLKGDVTTNAAGRISAGPNRENG